MNSIQTKKVLFKDIKPGMIIIMSSADYRLVIKTRTIKEFAPHYCNDSFVELTFLYQNKISVNGSYPDALISVFCFE
jgi:hypothetical protein